MSTSAGLHAIGGPNVASSDKPHTATSSNGFDDTRYASTTALCTALTTLLGIWAVVLALAIAVAALEAVLVWNRFAGGTPSAVSVFQQVPRALLELVRMVQIVGVGIGAMLSVSLIVLYAIWLHRSYRNLDGLGVSHRQSTPAWAVGSLFIPILQLVRPYTVMEELWAGSEPTQQQRSRRPARPVWLWWAFVLTYVVVSYQAMSAWLTTQSEPSAADRLAAMAGTQWAFVVSWAIGLAAAILTLRLVRGISTGQVRRYARNAEEGSVAVGKRDGQDVASSTSPRRRRWYCATDRGVLGPLTSAELRQAALEGRVKPETLVQTVENPARWHHAHRVRGLFASSHVDVARETAKHGRALPKVTAPGSSALWVPVMACSSALILFSTLCIGWGKQHWTNRRPLSAGPQTVDRAVVPTPPGSPVPNQQLTTTNKRSYIIESLDFPTPFEGTIGSPDAAMHPSTMEPIGYHILDRNAEKTTLVILLRVPAALLVPSEEEYEKLKVDPELREIITEPREHMRGYDPAEFKLVQNAHKQSADAFMTPHFDNAGWALLAGEMMRSELRRGVLPAVETMAIVWKLERGEPHPPFIIEDKLGRRVRVTKQELQWSEVCDLLSDDPFELPVIPSIHVPTIPTLVTIPRIHNSTPPGRHTESQTGVIPKIEAVDRPSTDREANEPRKLARITGILTVDGEERELSSVLREYLSVRGELSAMQSRISRAESSLRDNQRKLYDLNQEQREAVDRAADSVDRALRILEDGARLAPMSREEYSRRRAKLRHERREVERRVTEAFEPQAEKLRESVRSDRSSIDEHKRRERELKAQIHSLEAAFNSHAQLMVSNGLKKYDDVWHFVESSWHNSTAQEEHRQRFDTP